MCVLISVCTCESSGTFQLAQKSLSAPSQLVPWPQATADPLSRLRGSFVYARILCRWRHTSRYVLIVCLSSLQSVMFAYISKSLFIAKWPSCVDVPQFVFQLLTLGLFLGRSNYE